MTHHLQQLIFIPNCYKSIATTQLNTNPSGDIISKIEFTQHPDGTVIFLATYQFCATAVQSRIDLPLKDLCLSF
jgi:hypothetical protein